MSPTYIVYFLGATLGLKMYINQQPCVRPISWEKQFSRTLPMHMMTCISSGEGNQETAKYDKKGLGKDMRYIFGREIDLILFQEHCNHKNVLDILQNSDVSSLHKMQVYEEYLKTSRINQRITGVKLLAGKWDDYDDFLPATNAKK